MLHRCPPLEMGIAGKIFNTAYATESECSILAIYQVFNIILQQRSRKRNPFNGSLLVLKTAYFQ